MATLFYKGQLIETLSRDELLNVLRELSKFMPTSGTGTIQMTEAEAINLGLIHPTPLE